MREPWFLDTKIHEYANPQGNEMVKIERSKNGKYLYFLSNLDGMFYAEYQQD